MDKLRWKLREPHPPGMLILGDLEIEVDENGCFETEGMPDFPMYAIARRFPYRLEHVLKFR